MSLVMSAIGGGAGGNLLGMLMQNRSMGRNVNTILGGIVLTLLGSLFKKKPAAGA